MRLLLLSLFVWGMAVGAEMQAIPAISTDLTGSWWHLGLFALGGFATAFSVHRKLRKYRPLRLPRDQ